MEAEVILDSRARSRAVRVILNNAHAPSTVILIMRNKVMNKRYYRNTSTDYQHNSFQV